MATAGGARLLGRTDIGALEVGRRADLFLVDSRRLELVGAALDPRNMFATVGLRGPVDYTMVEGRFTVRQGRLALVEEEALAEAANQKVAVYLG